MSINEAKVTVTGRDSININDPPTDYYDRFHDIKRSIQSRADYEVQNSDVMDVLFDLYWIHLEDGQPQEADYL